MNFTEIALARQSCRSFDENRPVEEEKLQTIMAAARLAPSACNSQPYHFTVCRGALAKEVGKATMDLGMNKFVSQASVLIVISEENYGKSAAVGAKVKNNDFRSIDIGIATAYLTAEATAQGLSTCILGWLNDSKIRKLCNLEQTTRLVIALGYAKEGDPLRTKKRKDMEDLVTWL